MRILREIRCNAKSIALYVGRDIALGILCTVAVWSLLTVFADGMKAPVIQAFAALTVTLSVGMGLIQMFEHRTRHANAIEPRGDFEERKKAQWHEIAKTATSVIAVALIVIAAMHYAAAYAFLSSFITISP